MVTANIQYDKITSQFKYIKLATEKIDESKQLNAKK
jgi:hypothetical protein